MHLGVRLLEEGEPNLTRIAAVPVDRVGPRAACLPATVGHPGVSDDLLPLAVLVKAASGDQVLTSTSSVL